jgi:hypothetical protein
MTVGDLKRTLRELTADKIVSDDYVVAVSELGPQAGPDHFRAWPVRGLAVVDTYAKAPKMLVLTAKDASERVPLEEGDDA